MHCVTSPDGGRASEGRSSATTSRAGSARRHSQHRGAGRRGRPDRSARWPKVRIVMRGDGPPKQLAAMSLTCSAWRPTRASPRQRGCAATGKAYQTETSWTGCGQGRAPARRCQSAFRGDQPGQGKDRRPPPISARGEMENRGMPARPVRRPPQANQLRLWFASMAYVLLSELRRIALRHTQFADATCGTIR